MDAGTRAEVEAWFVRRGVPHLIEGYDAREDVLTRLRPLLLVLFVLGMALVLRPDWPWWGRILAVAAGLGMAAVLLAVGNRLRGRPWRTRPSRVGFGETAVLVLAPAVVNLLLGGTAGDSVLIAVEAVVVAVAGYVLVSLGVVSLLVHLGRAAVEGLAETASVAARAMPLMLAVLLFLFLATEVWQTLGVIEGWRFGAVFTAFAVLGVGVLVTALRGERRALIAPECGEALRGRAAGTPAHVLADSGVEPVVPPMRAMQRLNVSVALLVSLGIRVVAVGAAIGLFFLLFGLLVMSREVTAQWTGLAPDALHVMASLDTRRGEIVLTEPLVRVSTLLGAFAAVYFAVVAVGEEYNRREFVDDEIARLEAVTAAWAYYRGALAASPAGPPPADAAP